MNKNGKFLFPENISLTPYEFANVFTYNGAGAKVLDIINFLCPIESEYTNTPNHLFSIFKSHCTIICVKLMTMIFGVHTGYAVYIGASQDDLSEISRGFSDTFPAWVPDATWHKSRTSEMMYCASTVHRALLGRAERLRNMASINELIEDAGETGPDGHYTKASIEILTHILERTYANEYPKRDPICHIASFDDLPELFVQSVIDYYQEFFSRAGLTEPFIGSLEKECFKIAICHSIRNIISNLTNYHFTYVR